MMFALFDYKSKVLPAFCKPCENEILSSWLARLAYRHGVTTVKLCTLILNRQYGLNKDVDKLIKEEQIPILAERTNCTIQQVHATTLASYKNILFYSPDMRHCKEAWLLPSRYLMHGAHQPYHFNSGLLYCPGCVKKEAYFKKQWRLAISFVCPECGCYLVDKCPHCGKGNSLDGYMVGCHSCGNDITDCQMEMASPELVSLQKHLYEIMEYNKVGIAYIKELYLKVLYVVCSLLLKKSKGALRNLAEDVFELNDVSYHSIKQNELRLLDTKQRGDVISAVHWLLQKWPERFLNLCRNNYLVRDDLLEDLPQLPSWFIEPIYCNLEEKLPFEFKKQKKQIVEYTVRLKEMRIKTIDYDHDMEEYFDEEELFYEPEPGYKPLDNKYVPKDFYHSYFGKDSDIR